MKAHRVWLLVVLASILLGATLWAILIRSEFQLRAKLVAIGANAPSRWSILATPPYAGLAFSVLLGCAVLGLMWKKGPGPRR